MRPLGLCDNYAAPDTCLTVGCTTPCNQCRPMSGLAEVLASVGAGSLQGQHGERVEAAVLAWIAERLDEAREDVARELYAEERNDSMGFDEWPDYDSPENAGRSIFESHATAALDVIRRALGVDR